MSSFAQRLHHLGFVVASITDSVSDYRQQFGLRWDERVFHDPIQRVRVTFLESAIPGEPLFELVEPAGEASPVNRFLAAGGGLHHLCYEVEDIAGTLQRARELGAVIIRTPRPAVAFAGRRIAWVQTKQKVLTEYLERTPGA